MLFFALKKNSINDATIKSPKSVSSQRSLTVFLEAEKNMFDHLKAFITLSFFLNTGCLAALFQFRQDIKCCIILLSIGTEISLILYLISFLFLNISMSNLLEYNFDKFKTSRRISYMFSYFGVASSYGDICCNHKIQIRHNKYKKYSINNSTFNIYHFYEV